MREHLKLSEELPLGTPWIVQFFPVFGCNFRCPNCVFSEDYVPQKYVSNAIYMDFELFSKCLTDMEQFPEKVKTVVFAGIGEPLLHPNIVDMVALACSSGVSNCVELQTNASLLTQTVSDQLIDAGLDVLSVTLESLSGFAYLSEDRFNEALALLHDNVSYFFSKRTKSIVNIHLIEGMLQDEKRRRKLFERFSDISDNFEVVPLTRTGMTCDYDLRWLRNEQKDLKNSGGLQPARICPQPFYFIQINPDGNVVPCSAVSYPGVFGNVNSQSIADIWSSPSLVEFRRRLLSQIRLLGDVCGPCQLLRHGVSENDLLDEDARLLEQLYG